MTRLVGIIGHHLKHTLSPPFQQAALDHYQLNARYEVWDVGPEALKETVERLRGRDYFGANVTAPYKQAVLPLMDIVEGTAAAIGAVNTIVNREGRLSGHNTDAGGFLTALKREAFFELEDKSVLVLGAGGAARAVCFALLQEAAASLVIANRDRSRAVEIARSLRASRRELRVFEVGVVPWQSQEMRDAAQHSDLIVNCTTLGMKHGPGESISPLSAAEIAPNALVFDLVYNPEVTPLLRAATQSGARTLTGLFMLLYQGAAAFELWTGLQAPADIMNRALRKATDKF